MIPILRIRKFVDLLLEFVETDYTTQIDKTNSFLYRTLGDDTSDGYNFYTEAIELFTRTVKDKRKLETRLMFDPDRAQMPTIHVREPAKNKGKQDAIGYAGDEYFKVDTRNEQNEVIGSVVTGTKRKSFSAQYELMITAGSTLELVTIKEVLENALISALESMTLSINAFDLIDFSSREIIAQNSLIPDPVMMQSIILNIEYVKEGIPNLFSEDLLTTIIFNDPELLNF